MATPPIEISSCVMDQDPTLEDGQQLDFECAIRGLEMKWIKAHTLTDTGASATGFVSSAFIKQHHLPVVRLAQPRKLKLADDHLAPLITHCAQVYFRLGEHYDEIWCFVTSLGKFDLILGMPWLEQHDPKLSFRGRTLTFDSDFCTSRCLLHKKSCTVSSHSSRKNKVRPDHLTHKPGDLSKDVSNSCHHYQTIRKRTNPDDNMQKALGLARNPDTPDKEPATTLAANVIGQMPSRQWVLVPARSQAEASSWAKAYHFLSAASIRPRDDTPYNGTPVGRVNLAATVATSQAVTTKGYHSQPNLKLPTPPGRLVLPVAKESSQVWTDTAGFQDIVGNFYHRNREKIY